MSAVGVAVLAAVLLAATAFGLVRRRRAGAVRVQADADAPRISADDVGSALGERATMIQFSSAFCRPCVATRQVLGAAASRVPGVAHVEVDAESNLDLVRRLGIQATPTTVLVDSGGVERGRARGVPKLPEVVAALTAVVDK